MRASPTSVCGMKPVSYEPEATIVCGLNVQLYETLSYLCMRPEATSVFGLEPLLYAALSY
jgi:hypothetical protein